MCFPQSSQSKKTKADAGDPSASYIKNRLPNLTPASESSLTFAQEQLERCESSEHHQNCRRNAHQRSMPTRLIHLPSRDHQPFRRIYLTTPKGHVNYAALSYCWGGDQAQKTTKANLQASQLGIGISTLPQTIQDALHVTHRIGLQYLWIDSLCIIQDDEEDVSQEIAKMSDIFEGAYVTIAAASAATSGDGFLQPRIASGREAGFSFRFYSRDGSDGGVVLAPLVGDPQDPIMYRAWALQEILLSPRVLYYGSRQLRWLCRGGNESDGGARMSDFTHRAWRPQDLNLAPRIMDENTSANRHMVWRKIITAYSERRLSVPSDKLIAISAVAEVLNTAPKMRYMAGLWCEDFCNHLLWHKSGVSTELRDRSSVYLAPSWSWASVEGAVEWDPVTLFTYPPSSTLQLLRWGAESPMPPYGPVLSGHIEVKGVVRTEVWLRERKGFRDFESAVQTFPDTAEHRPPGEEMFVECLEVKAYQTESHKTLSVGLILVQITGTTTFRRVGSFRACYDGWDTPSQAGTLQTITIV